MFGNRERRRKEKRKMHFSFLCLICNKKGNQKKIYVFFLLLCPYKCERFIKFMGKYVTLCYIMLFIWALFFFFFFWTIVSLQICPNWVDCKSVSPREMVSALLFSSMITKLRKRLPFWSFLFSSSLLHLWEKERWGL